MSHFKHHISFSQAFQRYSTTRPKSNSYFRSEMLPPDICRKLLFPEGTEYTVIKVQLILLLRPSWQLRGTFPKTNSRYFFQLPQPASLEIVLSADSYLSKVIPS